MKCLNILIADDEEMVCNGLLNYINWEEHGMQVIGCVENGEQALEIIRKKAVDILITDICMPGMDGLELIEVMLEEEIKPVVIVISGYSDFNYAQKAIKSKMVFEYILKPIDLDELNKALEAAKVNINNSESNIMYTVLSEKEWKLFLRSDESGATEIQKCIIDAIQALDKEKAIHCFTEIWERLILKKISQILIKRYCLALVRTIIDTVLAERNSRQIFVEDPLLPITLIKDIEDLKDYVIKMIETGHEVLNRKENSNMSPLICAALEQINRNYHNSNFTLNLLADNLNVSPNYLSIRFKEEAGTGFVKYLNNLRVRKAKEMLRDVGLKNYIISERIGFEDVRYFSRIFKLYTGYSPTEYQRKLLGYNPLCE